MKNYFIRLFNYDKYANDLLCKSTISAGAPPKAVQLMAHLLAAQQIWLNRCKHEETTTVALWPDWQPDLFHEIIGRNHREWIIYINQLTEAGFSSSITYQNTKGEQFTNSVTDILTHVINHGTHHRAQVGQVLKLDSTEILPVTDYIFYIRGHK